MSHKKRHHFVPQFYLRLFATDTTKKVVGVFNLNAGLFIQSAPIRRQAYRNYFYGINPQREEVLARLEGRAASIIDQMNVNQLLPKHGSDAHDHLMAFVLSLMKRTESSIAQTNREIYEVSQAIHSQKYSGILDPSTVKLIDRDAVVMSVAHAFRAVPIVQDLHFRLLLNLTQSPFVTSDNPVILYNQYLEPRTPGQPITGLATSGLQIFLPVSPKACIVFYDPKIYRIGDRNSFCVYLDQEADVRALNLLQFGSAYQNIYFGMQTDEAYLRSLHRQSLTRPLQTQTKALSLQSAIDQDRYRVVLDKSELRANLRLSFVTLVRRAKKRSLDHSHVHTRSDRVELLLKQLSVGYID